MSEQIEVLVTVPLLPEQQRILQELSSDLHFVFISTREREDITDEIWQNAEILYTSVVLPTPEQAPNLKWIQFHRAGVDKFAEEPILTKPGLVATSMRGAVANKIAEYIIMMMLALEHKLHRLIEAQQNKLWPDDKDKLFETHELRGSTVGIVGYGGIGRRLAYLLQPFDVTILATKRNLTDFRYHGCFPDECGDPQAELPRRLYPRQALRTMFKDCDFVVVTAPLTKETARMIRRQHFDSMKSSAYFINVSRGGIVDYDALIDILKEERIAGAAIDVFPEEPLPPESALWETPNLLLTPHIAGNTIHYEEHAMKIFIENLKRYIEGKELCNKIDWKKGY